MIPRRPPRLALGVALALVLALAPGCAFLGAPAPRSRPLEPAPSAAGFAFIVHGIWPDGYWVPDQALALRRHGVEPLPVEYTSFLAGYVLGHGTDRPAAKIVAFARALLARHGASGCPTPVRLHGIGFSAGTMVLLKSAEAGGALERVYFGGSPLPAWSGRLEDVLAAGGIAALVNYCSPFDGIVGATLGCGTLGFLGERRGRVENRGHLRHHLVPVFADAEVADRVAREIAAGARGAAPHRCFEDPAFASWFRSAQTRLADEAAAEEPPPAAPPVRTPTPCKAAP